MKRTYSPIIGIPTNKTVRRVGSPKTKEQVDSIIKRKKNIKKYNLKECSINY